MPASRKFPLGTAAATLAVALVACNAIVGVGDVTLRDDQSQKAEPDSGDMVVDMTMDGTMPDRFVPPMTDAGADVTQPSLVIVGGLDHSCAKSQTGTIKCWGDNFYGQIGNGVTAPDGGSAPQVNVPTPIVGLGAGMIDVASGFTWSCAIKPDKTAACWGDDFYGQLGDGKKMTQTSTPVSVAGVSNVVQLSGGLSTTCAVISDGTVKCWGDNTDGLYGIGTKVDATTAQTVMNLTDAMQVSVSGRHACALRKNGTIACWGQNDRGQLGNGGTGEALTPSGVQVISNAVRVTLGFDSSCALLATGKVQCWGANDYGQLGNATSTASPNPTPVDVVQVSGASGLQMGIYHACALLQTGGVTCWGYNDDGELGDGVKNAEAGVPTPTAVKVVGITNATAIGGVYGYHACVTTKTGFISCWGSNYSGELGENGGPTTEYSPVNVIGYP